MKNATITSWHNKAFTLIETISVLVIVAIIMIATLKVHSRVRHVTMSINNKLDENRLTSEVLQRIAEDIDKLAAPGFDTKVSIQNKTEAGFNKAQLIIENKIYDTSNKAKTFERITWHAYYDPFLEEMILYRSHGGIALEDKLLDVITPEGDEEARSLADRQRLGNEPYIPICSGMTLFEIKALVDEKYSSSWTSDALPNAITINISFAPFVETETGEFEIPAEDIFTRTVAVDRSRKIKYKFIAREFDIEDPNSMDMDMDLDDTGDPNNPGPE